MKMMVLLLTTLCVTAACTGAPKFSDIQDKDWELVESWNKSESRPEDIHFERTQLISEGFSDIFTLRFDSKDKRINGVGAPNRFMAPYTLGNKQALSIDKIAQTQMIAIREPEKLKERDYFAYLQNVSAWNFANKKLELHSTADDGAEVVLYFAAGEKK